MRGAYGAVAVAVAALLVICSADPHQEQEGSAADRFEASGHKTRTLDPLGGNLVRAVRASSRYQYAMPPYVVSRYPGSDLNMFVNRRNFDEIDQTSMPFPYKRFSRLYRPNYIDSPFHGGMDQKRFHDIPMDEIDLSYFPIGSRR